MRPAINFQIISNNAQNDKDIQNIFKQLDEKMLSLAAKGCTSIKTELLNGLKHHQLEIAIIRIKDLGYTIEKTTLKEPDKNDGKSLVDVDGYCISWSK